MDFSYSIWAIFFVGYFNYTISSKIECHKHCVCNVQKWKAVCSGMELSYIPRFPNSITKVSIYHTNLSQIRRDGLLNLTFYSIIQLNLTRNYITYIDPKAFHNIYLRTLGISQEPLLNVNDVKHALSNLKVDKLNKLYLKDNQWTTLPDDMFSSHAVRSLRDLYLTGNILRHLNCRIFKHLRSFNVLQISDNYIEEIFLQGLPGVRYFYLSDNKLTKVPKMCKSTPKFFRSLKTLHLANNNIAIIGKETFKCLSGLEALNLDGNHIGRINNNVFSVMPMLKHLMLSRIGNPLKQIDDFAFNSSSLTSLTMRSARFHFDHTKFNHSTLFAFCPRMMNLDLSNNVLPKNLTKMKNMLLPLQNIRKLTFEKTDLIILPKELFWKFIFLETLRLQGNKIYHLESDIFRNMTSLHTLDLRLNYLSVINETSFPRSLLMSLKHLNLYGNPFSCTCDQMWFLNWSKKMKNKILNFDLYKCKHPPSMNKILLKNYHPTVDSCTPRNPLVTTVIIVSISGTFILLLIVLIVKCQKNIKNTLYLFRISVKNRKSYLPLDDGNNFEYHAFVVYCEADSDWVHSRFVRQVENEEGIKLCIHHREFDVGQSITENIDKFLEKSWKVVVILSNDFVKSEWCQWEVDMIQERRIKQGKDVFLLIMLKNIDSKHMTSQVRTLLDSTSYLKYSDSMGENLFWKAVIDGLRKPIGHPPVSVL